MRDLNVVDYVRNSKGYQVLTPDGFKHFNGISLMGQKQGLHLIFEDDIWVKCTNDHNIFINNNKKVPAKNIRLNDTILTSSGYKKLISKTKIASANVYDLIEVSDGNRFYTNGALVSNCFVINEETLINAITLMDMEGMEPIEVIGQVRWYKKIIPGHSYTVALDPSLGTGGDPAAIQIFDANTTTQVGEWKHNKTPCTTQIRVLVDIVKYIENITKEQHNIYYSVENNTIGEAVLMSIEDYGEHNIPGVFLSQPRTSGNVRLFRKGFNTTNKSKLSACSKLKLLIESKRMNVYSKSLISEFKYFVALGASYAAKKGEHDDLIMATILTVRMFDVLKGYHKELTEQLNDYSDEGLAPMPFLALF